MVEVFKCDICGQYIDEDKLIEGLHLCEDCVAFCPECKEEVIAHTMINGVCTKCNALNS